MSNREDPIEIEIKILNESSPAVPPEKSLEQPADKGILSTTANKVGQAAQSAAQKAWESETRKKVTDKVNETAAKQKDAISEAVSKAINDRVDAEKERMKRKIRETDWKEVAKSGARLGLKGLSAGVGLLAKKLKPSDRPEPSSTAAEEPPNQKPS